MIKDLSLKKVAVVLLLIATMLVMYVPIETAYADTTEVNSPVRIVFSPDKLSNTDVIRADMRYDKASGTNGNFKSAMVYLVFDSNTVQLAKIKTEGSTLSLNGKVTVTDVDYQSDISGDVCVLGSEIKDSDQAEQVAYITASGTDIILCWKVSDLNADKDYDVLSTVYFVPVGGKDVRATLATDVSSVFNIADEGYESIKKSKQSMLVTLCSDDSTEFVYAGEDPTSGTNLTSKEEASEPALLYTSEMAGDVTNDNAVNILDAAYLKYYLSNEATSFPIGVDVQRQVNVYNKSENEVNMADLIALERHLAGWNGYEW